VRLTHYKHGTILIDDEDAWVLNEFYLRPIIDHKPAPYARVRAVCKRTGKSRSLGRVLLNVTDSNLQVDHINHDGFDNRRENLRVVGRELQNANRRSNNPSGYKGVHEKDGGLSVWYRGRISRLGKEYFGKHRSSPELAALDFNRMAIALWGHQVVINEVRCVDMNPAPSERNCLFCNAPCHCCCVCFDPPSAGMRRLFDMLDVSERV
jgi:hypothetical protein